MMIFFFKFHRNEAVGMNEYSKHDRIILTPRTIEHAQCDDINCNFRLDLEQTISGN